MKENNSNKKNYKIIFCLVIIFILFITVVFLYINNKNKSVINNLGLGKYVITGMTVEPDYNYGIQSIVLEENNTCTIYDPYNLFYECIYEIKDKKLICKSLKEVISDDPSYEDLSEEIEIIFEFEILEDNNLKFTRVSDDSWDLTLNMEYVREGREQNEFQGTWKIKKVFDNSNGEIYEYSPDLKENVIVFGEYYNFSDTVSNVIFIESSDGMNIQEGTKKDGSYQIYDHKIFLDYNHDEIIEKVLMYHQNNKTIEMKVDDYTFILEKDFKEIEE